jgi:aldehyde dehydrogenase (NAD+)
MSDSTKNFIGGKWQAAASAKTFESINPATGKLVGACAASGPRDLEAAVEAAARAFETWRRTPAPRRAEFLFRLADLLRRHKESLSRCITTEMGKVLLEAGGDVQEAIDMALYMAGEGRRSFGQTVPSELPDKFAMSLREPAGVVAVITPWNFPIAVPSWKILPALVLGNTVVWKPSSDTPVCAARFVELFAQAGLPPGVLNLVTGPGRETGDALVRHPQVRLVTFTGSNEVGSHVAVEAARGGKRCALELGGKNAIIVLDDADLDLAVDGILWSAFGTSGQRCTAASRIIVHRDVRAPLTERLVERTRQLRLGDGLKPETDVGPVINEAALKKIEGYVKIGREEGARVLTGGKRHTEGGCEHGFFFQPTLFDGVKPDMRIAQEEIFGPVTCLIEARGLEEAVAINNSVPYGLVSAIYTRDVNRAFRTMRELSTGIVYVNAGTIGSEVQLPFGGTRGTGNGAREAGQAALDTFSEWKTVYVDYSGKLQRAQIDTAPLPK